MKGISLVLRRILFVMVIFYPVGLLLCACFGYRFTLNGVPGYCAVFAVLALLVVLFFKAPSEHRVDGVLMAILLPLSLVSALFYIAAVRSIVVVVSVFVTAVCCCILAIKHGKPIALKVVALVLSALMVVPAGFLGFMTYFFAHIGRNTVITTVESPNGEYYAELVDSDDGAFGGDTLVDVYEIGKLNAILFTIQKKPQRVYIGEWGEFRDMEIYWKDNHCLVINSAEYEIE